MDINAPFGSIDHLDALYTGLRDQYLLKKVSEVLEKHKRIMIVYGGSHLWTLHPALQDGFNSPAVTASKTPAPKPSC